MTASSLTERGILECRGCGSQHLQSALDLGSQPLANDLGHSSGDVLPAFPLHLRLCTACGLGQVGEYVTPERIFAHDYPYLSSTSSTWVEHARNYAAARVRDMSLGAADVVVEVASNDGYLLRAFQAHGVGVLGVEPAQNVGAVATAAGVPTWCRFFGAETARALVAEVGHPRLVVANNVMAHVPDLADFTAGLGELADDRTLITVENPSLLQLRIGRQFDTIYHEHFSYLTAHAVQRVAQGHGLDLVCVEQLQTHGGSNRYWLALSGTRDADASVERVLQDEASGGLLDMDAWRDFARESTSTIVGLRNWLDERREAGRRVVGYGAAAKGNTLLNAAGAGSDDLAYVVDGSRSKQGRYLPGSGVPIRAPASLADDPPDDVLVLPWNIAGELRDVVASLSPGSDVWTAVPRMVRFT